MNYYNEVDPYAAQWLRNLIEAGHIAPGVVDERSIVDVKADDLAGYRQCHFFAGIGVWSYALRLAGWPDDKPVWTGSCPCQPFSAIGKHAGTEDERHLWPEWYRLIAEQMPDVMFGEQVSSPHALAWFDDVSADLERKGYAIGALDTCGPRVGAPHIRQRLYFVAEKLPNSLRKRLEGSEQAWSAARADTRSGNGLVAEWWRTEPCMDRVDHGSACRVGRLRAYGNAIVPQIAAEVIASFLDTKYMAQVP